MTETFIQNILTAPKDGTWILGILNEFTPVELRLIRWSDSYSIHGLGGHWTDGIGQYGNFHVSGWINSPRLVERFLVLIADNAALGRKIDALLNHCDKNGGECLECSRIICPHGCELHFHHDGCPACAEEEASHETT